MNNSSETTLFGNEGNKRLIFGTKYIVTYKRWIILVIVGVTMFLGFFSTGFFGFINDVTTEYYQITPAETDLLSSLSQFPRFLIGFVLALMARKLNLNLILTATTIFLIVGNLLTGTGVASRDNFVITVFGQLLTGTSNIMAITLMQMVPSNWFPKNEHGKALSVSYISLRLSYISSNLIATRTLGQNQKQKNASLSNSTELQKYDESSLLTSFKDSFLICFFVLALLSFICFLSSVTYVTDYPPTMDGVKEPSKVHEQWRVTSELLDSFSLFLNKRFVSLLFIVIVSLSATPILSWMLTSVVLEGFPDLDDSIVGTMFCVGLSAAAFGSPIGGVLLDRYKRPKLTYVTAVTIYMLCYGLLSLSIYIHSFPMVFAVFVALAFLRDLCFLCITHSTVALLQDESDTTKIQGFGIAASFPSIALLGYTSLIRLIVEKGSSYVAALVPIPFHAVAVVLFLFVL